MEHPTTFLFQICLLFIIIDCQKFSHINMIYNNVGTNSYEALNSRGINSTVSVQVNRYLGINTYTAGKSRPYRVVAVVQVGKRTHKHKI